MDKRSRAFVGVYAGLTLGAIAIPGPWQDWSKSKLSNPVDFWTVIHGAVGALARYQEVPFKEFVVLSLAHEGLEYVLRQFMPNIFSSQPESIGNVAVDLAANFTGYVAVDLFLGR